MDPDARRVVVTGLGAVTPCGVGVPILWESMVEARSGLGTIRGFDTEGFATTIGGECSDFDGAELLGARAIRRLGKFMQYALVAADEAMADAGFSEGGSWPDPDRLGVYVGSGIGGFPEIVDSALKFQEGGVRSVSAYFIPRCLGNLATGQIAIRFNAQGPSVCVSTACAVGNHSIGEAWRAIKWADADVVVAGGTEGSLSPLAIAGFGNMKALSTRNDSPQTASRPFDRDRDGFVMSDGSGVVVLETLEHARARGARIYCELIGYGATTDAHHITAPAPGGRGAARCMTRALQVAGLNPEDVDYINAHGTSTPQNDPTETAAIRAVFGDHADRMLVSSTKGVTGHLLGAAGGVEAVATAKTLYTGIVPPTANHETPDPECDLDYVPNEAREARPKVALSNGFGFGGTNAVLAFRRFDD